MCFSVLSSSNWSESYSLKNRSFFPQYYLVLLDWLALTIYLQTLTLASSLIFICSVTYSPQLIHYYPCNKMANHFIIRLPCSSDVPLFAYSFDRKDEIGVGLSPSRVSSTSVFRPINLCQSLFWSRQLTYMKALLGTDCPLLPHSLCLHLVLSFPPPPDSFLCLYIPSFVSPMSSCLFFHSALTLITLIPMFSFFPQYAFLLLFLVCMLQNYWSWNTVTPCPTPHLHPHTPFLWSFDL